MLRAARQVSLERLSFLLRQLQWYQHLLYEANQFIMALDDFTDVLEDAGQGNQQLHAQLVGLRIQLVQYQNTCRMALVTTEQRIGRLCLRHPWNFWYCNSGWLRSKPTSACLWLFCPTSLMRCLRAEKEWELDFDCDMSVVEVAAYIYICIYLYIFNVFGEGYLSICHVLMWWDLAVQCSLFSPFGFFGS